MRPIETSHLLGAPLFPGEDEESAALDDAEHWVAVYEELISFLVEVSEHTCDKVASFRLRLDYWRKRRDELRPDRHLPDSSPATHVANP